MFRIISFLKYLRSYNIPLVNYRSSILEIFQNIPLSSPVISKFRRNSKVIDSAHSSRSRLPSTKASSFAHSKRWTWIGRNSLFASVHTLQNAERAMKAKGKKNRRGLHATESNKCRGCFVDIRSGNERGRERGEGFRRFSKNGEKGSRSMEHQGTIEKNLRHVLRFPRIDRYCSFHFIILVFGERNTSYRRFCLNKVSSIIYNNKK